MKKNDKLKYFMVIMLLFGSVMAFAQQGVVTGRVTDASNEPAIGVTVIVKGTTQGGITDIDGNFKLDNVQSDDVLVFSYVGFVTQEVIVGNQTVIDVVMQNDVTQLDELVVVGYGNPGKKRGDRCSKNCGNGKFTGSALIAGYTKTAGSNGRRTGKTNDREARTRYECSNSRTILHICRK